MTILNVTLPRVRSIAVCAFVFALLAAGVCAVPQDAAAQQNGAIKGVVSSPWVARYPAFVYVEHAAGQFPPPKQHIHMSQKGLVFRPHILPVLQGTTVDFTNDDSVPHNVMSPPGSPTVFNLGIYGTGVTKTEKFDNLGVVPLLCSVHPEMSAFVIVLQNPYYALSDSSGNFEIKNVPPGTYQLKVWNEKLEGPSQSVTVQSGKTATVEFKGLKKK